MTFIQRTLEPLLKQTLAKGKSILLLGARQTGKTTFLNQTVQASLSYSFLNAEVRQDFERNPENLLREIKAYRRLHPQDNHMIVILDEVQKIPNIMDTVQYAIDEKLAQFILTGSSARKLKRDHGDINLLPGRVVELHMDPLSLEELDAVDDSLEKLLLQGSLPGIWQEEDEAFREQLLMSYVNIYLEEEVRSEALVRNLASFSQFLKYAAIDAGKMVNISRLSQDIGVTRHTIEEYYQILLDCLVAERIEPLTSITSRRRLSKAPKYLLFDMGVRRVAAGEGLQLPERYYGELFEQFIGLEILRFLRQHAPNARLYYWRDHNGPEVDYVIEYNRSYFPIEVKYTKNPTSTDTKHLTSFMEEYDCPKGGLVICRNERARELQENMLAIPWSSLPQVLKTWLGLL